MIVPSAMVKAADHMKNYVMNVMNTPVHDRLGKRVSVHDQLGGRTMLRDPTRRRVPVHDRLE